MKKTPLEQYSRPKQVGIIAINLKEGDELVAATIANVDDEIIMCSSRGQAVRFRQAAARSSGRNAQGVRGIKLRSGDTCVGMVVADPDATLLTVCEKGYGKRTPIGPNSPAVDVPEDEAADESTDARARSQRRRGRRSGDSSSSRYPTKGRGTMGVRDIKTTDRNGPVVAIEVVRDSDELLLDDRPRQAPAHSRQRHQRHRPQHAGRADHEPRRRRHRRRRRPRATGGRR